MKLFDLLDDWLAHADAAIFGWAAVGAGAFLIAVACSAAAARWMLKGVLS